MKNKDVENKFWWFVPDGLVDERWCKE